jgi:hypothetical protein
VGNHLNHHKQLISYLSRLSQWRKLTLLLLWLTAIAVPVIAAAQPLRPILYSVAQATNNIGLQDDVIVNIEPGKDIGAEIDAAKSALPVDPYGVAVGVIRIPGNKDAVYYFSTSIELNSLNVTIDCQGATLVWTGPNAAAAVILAAPLRRHPNGNQALIAVGSANGGLDNCNLQTLQTYLNSRHNNTPTNPAFIPSIRSLEVNSGGRGYTVGDIVQILQNGGALGTATVTAVAGGTVTGLSVLHGGYNYTDEAALATSGGMGAGLTVNIAINPPVSCYPYNNSPTLPTAIFSGGDPTGTIAGDPPTNYGNNQFLQHVHISGFCGAFVPGNNSWQEQFDGVIFDHNYWDIDDEYNRLITNTGERSTFVNSRLDGATGAAIRNDGGSQFTIGVGTSIDYNEQLNNDGQWTGGAPVVGSFSLLDFESAHIEDQCGPVIAEYGHYRGYVNVTDGDIRLASSKACSTAYFWIAGQKGGFSASHVLYNSMHTVPFYVRNPTNGAILDISDPIQGSEGKLPSSFSTNGTQPISNYGASNSYSPMNPGFIWTYTGSSTSTVAGFRIPSLGNFGSPAHAESADLYVGRDGENYNNVRLRFHNVGGAGARTNYGSLLVGGEATPDLQFGNGTVLVPGALAAGSHAGIGNAALATGIAAGTNARIECTAEHACDSASGSVTLTTGLHPDTGTLAKISFGTIRTKAANCVVDILSTAGLVTSDTWKESAKTLILIADAAPAASTAYTIKYWCGGD